MVVTPALQGRFASVRSGRPLPAIVMAAAMTACLTLIGGCGGSTGSEHRPSTDASQPAPDARTFAGEFSGEGISLLLTPADSGFEGTLVLNDTRYPLTVHGEGAGLAGTFRDPDGHTFPISLAWQGQGDTLILQSGTNTMTLTRRNARNPLDDARPRNPLDRRDEPLASGGSEQAAERSDHRSGASSADGSGQSSSSPPPVLADEERARLEAEARQLSETAGQTTDPARAGLAEVSRSAGWKTYQHALGPYFDYPGDWTIQEGLDGYILIPNDFKQGSELIIAFGDDAGGLTDPANAQVGAYLDQVMMMVESGLRRSGSVESVRTRDGRGARFTYTGTRSDGRRGTARIYTTIMGRHAVALAIVASDDQLRARDATVQQIFNTFGMGRPRRDGQLVGVWRYEDVDSSISGTGSVSFTGHHTFEFAADGTVQYTYSSRLGVDVPGASGSSRGADVSRGTWIADNGRLTIHWDNGRQTEYTYRFVPDQGAVLLQREGQSKPRGYRKRG